MYSGIELNAFAVYYRLYSSVRTFEIIKDTAISDYSCLTLPDPVYFIIGRSARVGYNPTRTIATIK